MSNLARRASPDRLVWRRRWLGAPLVLILAPIAFLYVFLSFTALSQDARIILRSAPVLPLAIWTLWLDRQRPFEGLSPWRRLAARVLSLLGIMALTVALLGVALNWLYDPSRAL